MHPPAHAHGQKPSSVEKTKELIRSVDLRVTPARIALFELLIPTEKPLKIEDMAEALKEIGMDKATIYRNIAILQTKHLVRQVDLHQDHAYYEWNDRTDHHHLICIKCNDIEDFSGCDFSSLERSALNQSKLFSRVVEHSFELFGICKRCDV